MRVYVRRASEGGLEEEAKAMQASVHRNVLLLLKSWGSAPGREGFPAVKNHIACSPFPLRTLAVEKERRRENELSFFGGVGTMLLCLLSALDHLSAVGVEHRRVCPDSILVYTVRTISLCLI